METILVIQKVKKVPLVQWKVNHLQKLLSLSLLIVLVPTITISEHTDLTLGSGVHIICNTVPPISNSTIKWESLLNSNNSNELIINSVMLSHNKTTFTCVVSSHLLIHDLMKSITITVIGLLRYNFLFM